jgi:hypothetical protein
MEDSTPTKSPQKETSLLDRIFHRIAISRRNGGTAKDILTTEFWGFGIAIIGIAFFAQPFMRFISPVKLLETGLLGGLSVVHLHFSFWSLKNWVRATNFIIMMVFVLILLFNLISAADIAQSAIEANDRRCSAVQHDMLVSTARRGDDAQLFQALGCRPQASEMPTFPAPALEVKNVHTETAKRISAVMPVRRN